MKNIQKYYLYILFSFFFCFTVQATSYTWNGTSGTAWNTAANWTPNGVPGSADNVTINTATNYPVLDTVRTITNLTIHTGTFGLNTYSLTINGTATFNGGTISNGVIKPRGTVVTFNGGTFSCTVDAVCGQVKFNGGTFNNKVYADHTSTSSATGNGGCTFNDSLFITKSGGSYLRFASVNPDIYNGVVKVTNTSAYVVQFSYGATGSQFNEDVILNNTGSGGVSFGANEGTATLAWRKTLSIGSSGWSDATLLLKNLTVAGGTTHSVDLASNASVLNITNCNFTGEATFSAASVLCKTSTFNSDVSFTKSANNANYWDGGNTFNGKLTINNNGASNSTVRMALTEPDSYNGNVELNVLTSGYIQMAYSGASQYKGNIEINSNNVNFNSGTGTVTMNGTGNQFLKGDEEYAIDKLIINKPSGNLVLNEDVYIDSSITFTKGHIDNVYPVYSLVLKAGSSVTGASDSSYVMGAVKKIGSTAFTFPTGKGGYYRAIGISAPAQTTDAFTAEFINTGQTLGNDADSALGEINSCDYWTLNRSVGNSSVAVELHWNNLSNCFVNIPSHYRAASWNGTKWKDAGSDTIVLESQGGYIKSNDGQNNFYAYSFSFAPQYYIHYDDVVNVYDESGGNPIPLYDVCVGTVISLSLTAPTQAWMLNDINNLGSTFYVYWDVPNSTCTSASPPPLTYNQTLTCTLTTAGLITIGVHVVGIPTSTPFLSYNSTFQLNVLPAPQVTITANPSNIICNNNPITLSASGSFTSYLWSTGATTQNISVNTAGNYTVTVTDAAGCTAQQSITVTNNTITLVTTSTPACNGVNGSASVTASGGSGTLTYLWSTGSTNTSISGLSPATYTITVTDASGCSAQQTVTVGNTTLSVTTSPVPACAGSNGSVTATVSGGAGTITYLWNNGATTSSISGLVSGSYTVTVTDANGCSATANATVGNTTLSVTVTTIGACSGSNGTATASVTGGVAPLTYQWSGSSSTTAVASGLGLGYYTVTVTDANGCSKSTLVKINPFNLPAPVVTGHHYSCRDGNLFTVTNINASATYTWQINYGSGNPVNGTGTFAAVNNPVVGYYTVTFTATSTVNTACTATTVFEVFPCCEGDENPNISATSPPTYMTFTDVTASYLLSLADPGELLYGYILLNDPNHYANTLYMGECEDSDLLFYIPTGPKIAINGTLLIDVDQFHIENARLLMGPCAQIIVEPLPANENRTLHVHGCSWLHGCGEYMWNGIINQKDGYVRIDPQHVANPPFSNSYIPANFPVIEDALVAVEASDNGDISVLSARLNKNHRNIVIYGRGANNPVPSLDLEMSQLTCSNNYNGLAENITLRPHNGGRSYSGVEVFDVHTHNNAVFRIGDYNLPPIPIVGWCPPCTTNHFFNLDYGIRSTNSSIRVQHNTFEKINNVANSGGGLPNTEPANDIGTAIWVTNKAYQATVQVGGYDIVNSNNAAANSFIDCKRGVYAKNEFNLTAEYCTFERITYSALDLYNSRNTPAFIDNNTFTDCNRGINMRNMFHIDDGINFFDAHTITNNIYTHPNPLQNLTGIASPVRWFVNVENPGGMQPTPLNIANNSASDCYHGVRLVNVGGRNYSALIENNDFFLPTQLSTPWYGVRTMGSNNVTLDGNLIERLGVSVAPTWTGLTRPAGLSVETSVNVTALNNSFYYMNSGMRFFNCWGNEYLSCNLMDNNKRGVLIDNSWIGDQGLWDASAQGWLPQDNQWVVANAPTNLAAIGLGSFLPSDWYTRDNSLYPFCAEDQMPTINSSFEPVLMQLVSGAPAPACDNPTNRFANELNYVLKVAKEEGWYIDLGSYAQWLAKLKAYNLLKDDSTLMNQSTPDDSILQAYYNYYKTVDIGKLHNVKEYVNLGDAENAMTHNSSIAGTEQSAYNCKVVNEIYLRTWAVDTFKLNEVDSSTLAEIAYQSPAEAGPCVYGARVMLDVDVDDGTIEEGEGRLAGPLAEKETEKNVVFQLYPNPASGLLNIETNEEGVLSIKAITGNGVITQICNRGKTSISIDQLAGGIYIYQYLTTNGNQLNGKLVVTE